ncbi:MAG: glutathione S-transferase family protein [Candidatus Puniceispirillaceae bacterium]
MSDFLLHHYWPSPFAHKVRIALNMTGAAWTSVEIPRVPPKPLLMPMTAGYRRTPVLQIGADIYCDTQNIARALAEAGHEEALFPNRQHGLVMALSGWIDQTIVELAIRTVITSAIGTAPTEFIKDRGDLYFEPGWTEESLKAGLPAVILQLGAQVEHAERALQATGYLAGAQPSWADAGLGFAAWFLRGRWADGADFLSRYPAIERLEAELAANAESHDTTMTGEQALAVALKAEPTSPTGIRHPACDLSAGQKVMIRPRAQSADPDIVGRLRYLDMTRVSIDHESPQTGPVAVHLPLAGYRVSAA